MRATRSRKILSSCFRQSFPFKFYLPAFHEVPGKREKTSLAQDDELKTLRVSTGPFHGKDGTEAFLEIWGREILRMEMTPLENHPLDIDLTLRALPHFAMAAGSVSPVRNRHTNALIDNDDLVLVVIREGAGEVNQYGRVATIKEGEAVLTANGSPATFTGLMKTQVMNFRLNREFLKQRIADVDDLVIRPIASGNRTLLLLTVYANVLHDQKELGTPELRHMVASHMHDLAALVIGANRDTRDIARGRGVRAARLRSIKDSILGDLARHDLSLGAVAAQHGITPRYLNMLFEDEETTFSEFVLAQRLTQARRLLSDPRFKARSISSIAFGVGFGDLSYFNRTFRRRFGMTPSEARDAARRQ